jgi:ribosomal protein S18 acetylase RimI-like enzyme
MAQTRPVEPETAEPTIRPFSFRRDCDQVLDFQYEVYERNFPGLVVDAFFLEDYRRDLRRAARDRNEALFVMEQAGELCGFVWAAVISTVVDARVGYIKNVYVAPHLRGCGQAERLMATAEAWLRQQGLAKIMLDASVVNQRALRFYQRLGYVTERVRMVKRARAQGNTREQNRGTVDG